MKTISKNEFVDPGGMEERQKLIESAADEWVRTQWSRLDSRTRSILKEVGYVTSCEFKEPPFGCDPPYWFEVRQLIGLGALLGKAGLRPDDKNCGQWPLVLDDETQLLARTLLEFGRAQTPTLIWIALRAVVVTHTARLVSIDQMMGKYRKPASSAGLMAELAIRVISIVLLPASLGALVTYGGRGEMGLAIGSAFGLVMSASVVADAFRNEHEERKRPSARWKALLWHGLHGTGAGIRTHLEAMVQDGIPVPAVAIDLCQALQAAYDRRVHKEVTESMAPLSSQLSHSTVDTH